MANKSFDAVMAQYEKSKMAASGNSNRVSNEERLKKYFTTLLPKGVQEQERRIRILPTKDGSSPFVEIYFHEVQVDGKWVKLYDPKQEGKRSPLNDVYDGLLLTGTEADKELAKQYRARKFYIVKLIDRDNEQDGPKFWRFKYNSKGDGALDKIFPIFKNRGDITDIDTGRDLTLTLRLTKSPNGKEYTSISSVIPEDASPLHTDPAMAKTWAEDAMTWSDVYSKKPEEYLEMVACGEVPKWDNESKKWVSTKESSEIIASQNAAVNTVVTDPQIEDAPDDDLPF